MAKVQRFDFASIGKKPTRTSQGFLRIDANLTRVGVLLYRNEDGSVRRELRHPDEVFNADSLASIAAAPVTDLHPSDGLVTPDNVGDHRRGHVSDMVTTDSGKRFITAPIYVEDRSLIDLVERGDRRELSPGYTCVLDETPGNWNGERYDAIQRDIRYNHVALGPKGWGRSGSEVALKMDSGLVSYESKAEPSGASAIANLPEPSRAVGKFVRAKLEEAGKTTAHLADALKADVWAVESFLDGYWGCLASNQSYLKDPDGARQPETGLLKRSEMEAVAKFIGVETDALLELVPVAERGDGRSQRKRNTKKRNDAMDMEEIEFEGLKFEVPSAIAGAVKKAIADKAAAVTDAEAETAAAEKKAVEAEAKADAASARADAADAKAADLQKRLDAATAPEAFAAAVKARVELESTARKVVGDSADFNGKSDAEIKVAVIAHFDTKFSAEGKSPEYVAARFDAHVAGVAETQDRQDANAKAALLALKSRVNNDSGETEESAAAAAAERSRNAWNTAK